MRHKITIAALLFLLLLLLCLTSVWKEQQKEKTPEEEREELVVYSSHPVDFLRPLIKEFESRTGIWVTVINGGTGEIVERLEQEQENPYADILWGGSLSTLRPQSYLFEEYASVNEDAIQDEFKNVEGIFTRFSDVPSVLMVNKDLIGNITIKGYGDLLNEKLKGKIAFCSPGVSSSAYEHLINMLYAMGDGDLDAGWDFVKKFCENLDGNLLTSSTEVYRGVADGEYVVGLTFEEAAAALVAGGDNIQIVYMEEGVNSTPDCVCIVKNTAHRENARKFIDFVTGYEAQTMLTTKLNRRSVRVDVAVPEYLQQKEKMTIIHADAELINVKKKEWITNFKKIFYDSNGD
ncbi:MAG: extracellular solute-binding protein [Lachnospiraceae bacterium]|nr:extracellular solute-binding protein [Lachnospiraceae bacterium]